MNQQVYNEYSNKNFSIYRKCLYLVHPIIASVWIPLALGRQKIYLFKLISTLTLVLFFALGSYDFIRGTKIVFFLNCLTAELSAGLLSFFIEYQINVDGVYFGNQLFLIEVKDACSSVSQIILAVNAIIVFYLCCKINSKIKVITILSISLLIAFVFNSIRITMLAHIIYSDKTEAFDYWHSGAGSLIFSFVIMLFSSTTYYFFWTKESRDV